jgi:hypothetical protein
VSMALTINLYKHRLDVMIRPHAINLRFRKKCPAPGNTKADNNTARLALLNFDPQFCCR